MYFPEGNRNKTNYWTVVFNSTMGAAAGVVVYMCLRIMVSVSDMLALHALTCSRRMESPTADLCDKFMRVQAKRHIYVQVIHMLVSCSISEDY